MTSDTAGHVESQRQPRYAWPVMGQLWGMDLLGTMVFFSIGVLLPVWKEDLGITPFQAGLLGSAGFLGFGTMALPASIWLTRYNPRLVTLACAFGMSAAAVAQAASPTALVLLVTRFAFVLLAVSRIQMQVLFIQQWFQQRLYAMVNSMDFANRALAQTLAVAATPVLVALLGGWRSFYVAVAVAMAAVGVVWAFFGREREISREDGAPRARSGNPIGVLRRHKSLWVLASAQIGGAMAFASFITFYPTYAIDRLGLSLTEAGLVMSAFPIGAMVGSLSSGPLSQLLGRRKPFIWVPGLLLPVLYMTVLRVDSVPVSMLLLLLAGSAAMAVPPILATVPLDMKLAPREVAVALGLVRTLFPIGATLGPLLVGTLQQSTGSLLLGLSIVSPMAVTLLIGGSLMTETGPRGRRAARAGP
jgi:predicted MFS family arabinose efflux permease